MLSSPILSQHQLVIPGRFYREESAILRGVFLEHFSKEKLWGFPAEVLSARPHSVRLA